MSDHSNVVAADLPEPYSAEVGLQRHIEQAHAISSLLSEAGVGPCSLPEGVRLLMNDRDRLADALAAERIENTRLREAFVTMEKAYNEAEAAIAALKDYVCRELTVIEFRCDHERREHKTASELTSLYLDVKAWARREP